MHKECVGLVSAFSILTPSEKGVQQCVRSLVNAPCLVSILTPSEKGVQRPKDAAQAGGPGVSILTPSEKGVQPSSYSALHALVTSFNPHPLRKGGATGDIARSLPFEKFQSSPPPKRGCNQQPLALNLQIRPVSILTPSEKGVQHRGPGAGGRVDDVSILTPSEKGVQRASSGILPMLITGFNPHPLRKGGATSDNFGVGTDVRPFQSSPPPKRGCNYVDFLDYMDVFNVSILTPSEKGCNGVLAPRIALPLVVGLWLNPVPPSFPRGCPSRDLRGSLLCRRTAPGPRECQITKGSRMSNFGCFPAR